MVKEQKAAWYIRLLRLGKMLCWLVRTGRSLRKLDGSEEKRRQCILTLGREALLALDIKLETSGNTELPQGTLIAANHVSWLDIFALSAVYPSSFIAKQEISRWPVLGKMGSNAGTVFINRDSRRDIEPINQAICTALKAGKNVSFFPEAKTSSGLDVLPFKAALFQSAIDAQAPVCAVALRYFNAQGERTMTPSYADVDLLTSFWRILSLKEIRIRMDFSPVFYAGREETEDRYILKDRMEATVKAVVCLSENNS